jgi:hypothetical protein
MASVRKYQVYNRRQQGLAETTRLILEYAGAEYENVFVEVGSSLPMVNYQPAQGQDLTSTQDWETEKASTPLQQLPVLRVCKENGELVLLSSALASAFMALHC